MRNRYLINAYDSLTTNLIDIHDELEEGLSEYGGEVVLAAHTPWEDYRYKNFEKENALHRGDPLYGSYQERFVVGILTRTRLLFEETETGMRCRLPVSVWLYPEGRTSYTLPAYEDVPFPAIPKIILREKTKPLLGTYERLPVDRISTLVVGNTQCEEWLKKHKPKAKFRELLASFEEEMI